MRYRTFDITTMREKPDIPYILKEMNKISMNYIGNKRKILGWIYESLEEENIYLEDYAVFDAFAGGGSFSIFSKMCNCPVIVTNDLMKNAWVNHKVLVEGDDYTLSATEKEELLNHKGIYKELLDWLQTQDYKWFSDSDEKKEEMIKYVTEKSVGNKYLEFMLNYVGKFFTLKECIELASFREFIDKNEEGL
jgi:adenine-specific DNA methylase